MTGNKRSHTSRSKSRSVSPDKTKYCKTSKGSSEQNELREKVKHKRSSGSDRPVSASSKECTKLKKIKSKSRHSSASSDSSVDSQNDSLCSSRDSNRSKAKEKKKLKKLERKRQKKEKKLKKKRKKEKRKHKKSSAASATKMEKTVDAKPEVLQNREPVEPADRLLMDRAKAMAPMTKEEWEKRQSVIRRVYDEETGRHRLIKGDGEVLEEIVSRERHREINQQATKGDAAFFQSTMAAKLNKQKKFC